MAEVFGTIGNEPVELNNAATETTLRALLDAVISKGGLGAASQTAQLAAIAGIKKAGEESSKLAEELSKASKNGIAFGQRLGALHNAADALSQKFDQLQKQLGTFTQALVDGTAQVSDFYKACAQMPGILGRVANAFSILAEFQEKNLQQYQSITNAGANFGGSLTQLRQSALNTYMSFEQFSKVVSQNGDALSRMGGTVDQGAKSFVRLSNSLLSSKAGDELRALGYTTEQVNQGMLSYINMTGGRTREELKNTKDITAASAEYLTQLDGLAQLTGKSREEQEKALKEANQNAAIQQKLATMDEKQKAAYNRGLAEMEMKFGKAGREMYQAQILGIPPMTEAAQKLTALSPEVARASQGMADVAKRGGSTAETLRYSAQATEGAVKSAQRLSNVTGALSFQSGATSEALMNLTKAANQARQQGRTTEAEELEARAKILEEQEKRQKSEAAAAAEAQKAIQELGQSVMQLLVPLIKIFTPILNTVVKFFGELAKVLAEYKSVTLGLISALVAYLAYQKYANTMNALKKIQKESGKKGGVEGLKDIGKAIFTGGKGDLGSSALNPMYVMIVGRVPGIGGGKGGPGGPGSTGGGTGGTGGKTPPANREERIKKVEEGRKLQQAAKGLKAAGVVGAVAGLASLGADLYDIKKQKDEGKISEAEAKKQTGGTVGETGGALAGAAAGAALGSVVPVVGTVIGGIIGAYAGGWLGKKGGEALASDPADKIKKEEEKPKMAEGGIVSKATEVIAGEAGPEAIIPLTKFESLRDELQMLNKQTAEMIIFLRETAEYTRRNVDATKSLSGDLFKG